MFSVCDTEAAKLAAPMQGADVKQMWELPGPKAGQRVSRITVAMTLVWAVIAVPLTLWLALREHPVATPPPTRDLSVMERTAVRSTAQALATAPITVKSTVTSANAQLEVEQIADAASGVAYGRVTSKSQAADLLVIGERVLLRGSSQFWATVGVMTADASWIEVGDHLGVIPFPLAAAVNKLDPVRGSFVGNPVADAETMTFHNGNLAATFTEAAISQLNVAGRDGKLSSAPANAALQIEATASASVPAAKLIGASGSLTVSAAPPPPPLSTEAPGAGGQPGN